MDITIMVLTTVKHNIYASWIHATFHHITHFNISTQQTGSITNHVHVHVYIYVWWRNKLHFLFEITVTFNMSPHNEITAIVTEIICTWRGWLVGLLSSAANGKGYTGIFSLLVAPSFPPSVCLCLCICLWGMLGKNLLTISITFLE